jgi:hypothetical protein
VQDPNCLEELNPGGLGQDPYGGGGATAATPIYPTSPTYIGMGAPLSGHQIIEKSKAWTKSLQKRNFFYIFEENIAACVSSSTKRRHPTKLRKKLSLLLSANTP